MQTYNILDYGAIADGVTNCAPAIQKAVDEAKGEIADLALDIAGKVVGKTMDGADHSQLVDQFIDELGESL